MESRTMFALSSPLVGAGEFSVSIVTLLMSKDLGDGVSFFEEEPTFSRRCAQGSFLPIHFYAQDQDRASALSNKKHRPYLRGRLPRTSTPDAAIEPEWSCPEITHSWLPSLDHLVVTGESNGTQTIGLSSHHQPDALPSI